MLNYRSNRSTFCGYPLNIAIELRMNNPLKLFKTPMNVNI